MLPKKLSKQVLCSQDAPIVQTASGKIRGLFYDGVYMFRGIKYANAKRFEMPTPVEPWEGVKDALVLGAECCQPSIEVSVDAYVVPHRCFPTDENCQYLNVWSTGISGNEKKPVMVWIHGGGCAFGSGSNMFAYDGEELSKFGDVVVVTLNHRINILGYLDLSAYGEKYKYSGNAGTADIVMALQWVRDNIAAFGGDPENVTIFGQSGGGFKVRALMQTPAADGLFSKAIVQSGSLPSMDSNVDSKTAHVMTDLILDAFGYSADEVDKLQTIPYYQLAKIAFPAVKAYGGAIGWGPVVDGDYYLGIDADRPETRHIPVIVGSVLGEVNSDYNRPAGVPSRKDWDEETFENELAKRFGENKDTVRALFAEAYPEKDPTDVFQMDYDSRLGVIGYASHNSSLGHPVYTFVFAMEQPVSGGVTPWHCAEIPFVFHNAQYMEASYVPGITEKLQDLMAGAWVNFAKTGVPAENWKPFTEEAPYVMVFDKETVLRCGHDHELLKNIVIPGAGFLIPGGDNEMIFGFGPRQCR